MIFRKSLNRSLAAVCLIACSLVFVTESQACHYLRWCRYQHLKAYFEAYGGGTSGSTGTTGTTAATGTTTTTTGAANVGGNAEAVAALEKKAADARKAKAAEELKKAKEDEATKNKEALAAEQKANEAKATLEAASGAEKGAAQDAFNKADAEAKAARKAADDAKAAREALENKGGDAGGVGGPIPEAGVESHFFVGLETGDASWRTNIDGLGESIKKLKGLNKLHAEVVRLRDDVELVRKEAKANGLMLQEVLQLLRRAPQVPPVLAPVEVEPPVVAPAPDTPEPGPSAPEAG